MQPESKHTVSLRLDAATYERLVRQSKDQRRSLNFLVNDIIRQQAGTGDRHDQHEPEAK